MPLKRIPEDYIHYIWKYRLFDQLALMTSDSEPVEILSCGFHNHHSGPDFHDARIKIGEQLWAGNVEIHFKSSDWNAHAHDKDPAYDNVILHVVMMHDKEVKTQSGSTLKTLSLSSRFEIDHYRRFQEFIMSKSWIPCDGQLEKLDSFHWVEIKEKMMIERLEQRSEFIFTNLKRYKGDWEQVLYLLLARAFGAKVNSEPFQVLAHLTPLDIVMKHRDDELMLEALFLGQAGFFNADLNSEYAIQLKNEYTFLKHKYNLEPMRSSAWKHARIRPASAPQVRIVQFSRLWSLRPSLHSAILAARIDELHDLFSIRLDGFWEDHHSIEKPSKRTSKAIGDSLIERIIINCVIPLRFAYGMHLNDDSYKESALSLLRSLRPEDNSIIKKWSERGIEVNDALEAQALLQLKKEHCDKKDCLNCSIGQRILKDVG